MYCFLFDALRKTEAGNFEHSPGDRVALLPVVLAFWDSFRGPTVRDVVTRNSAEPDPCSPPLQPRSQSLVIFKQATLTGLASVRIQEEQGRHINTYCAGLKTQIRISGTFIEARSSHVLICNLSVPAGKQSYRQAHRLASLQYTESIKQQRDPASNKMDHEDQLLRLSPGLHMHTMAHTCPHSPT